MSNKFSMLSINLRGTIYYSLKKRLKILIRKVYKHTKNDYKISFSQCGEDLIIDYIFKLRKIYQPTYVDIGCNEPFNLNNTALFYKKGSRGVNIDANPFLIDKLKLARPYDISICIGIHSEVGSQKFYIMNDHTLSTFSKDEADIIISNPNYYVEKVVEVQLTKLSTIFDKYFNGDAPDLLCIDVEGLDFEIIKSIDFDVFKPKIICIEAAEYSSKGTGQRKSFLINYIADRGYYEYAHTNLNSILVKNEFWFV